MMNERGTPGGHRLKALRHARGKTQLDVEFEASLGLGYLQRLESGKVQHPERETLDRILTALGARYTERRDILEVFGYVVDAPMPNADEIAWAVNVCQTELNSAVFPAYLLDCAHRLLTWNHLLPKLFIDVPLQQSRSEKRYLSMMRILFDSAFGLTDHIANPDTFLPAQMRALRYEMVLFPDEPWYESLIKEMRGCATFERYWTQAETQPVSHVAARPLTILEFASPEGDVWQFRVMSESFAQDRRFRVIYLPPADPKTMEQCLRWFQANTETD
jgi:transcriptional regulator with XRE-family HTH domain